MGKSRKAICLSNEISSVIVVGAGASAEFGLPVGRSLLQSVASHCLLREASGRIRNSSVNAYIHEAIRDIFSPTNSREQDEYYKAADVISRGAPLSTSIDRFIDTHKDDQKVADLAKLAITNIILEAESASSLGSATNSRSMHEFAIDYLKETKGKHGVNIRPPSDTWIAQTFRLLAEGSSFADPLRKIIRRLASSVSTMIGASKDFF